MSSLGSLFGPFVQEWVYTVCSVVFLQGFAQCFSLVTTVVSLLPLQALVPVTIEVEVPFDLHRYIIGQKGSGIRKMMDEFEVSRVLFLSLLDARLAPSRHWCVRLTGLVHNSDYLEATRTLM